MKPKQLILSGWGPYKNKETVDFEQLNTGGVFLITGPTGSGKTTIFDGISYGLFGMPSGSIRERVSMRSDFATADQETFVTLVFEHKGSEYEITRYPKYMRPKKRGDGEIASIEKAILRLPDGGIIEKINSVNEKIVEILGINHHQFKQIAMIAQGEFQSLLVSDSDSKAEIFRNIFGTEIFNEIEHLLAQKGKEAYASVKNLQTRLEESVAPLKDSRHEQVCQAVSGQDISYKDLLGKLKEAIDLDEKQINQLEEKLGKDKNKENKLENLVKDVEKSKSRLEAVSSQLADIEQHKIQVEEVFVQAKEKYSFRPKMQEQLQQLQEKKVTLDNQAEELKKLKEKEDTLKSAESGLEKAKEKLKQLENHCLKAKENIGENIEEDLPQILLAENRRQMDLAVSQLEDAKAEEKQALNLIKDIHKYAQTETETKKAEQLMTEKQHRYRQMDIEYKNAIAGILASKLEDNQPCPVCGSCNHPAPAKLENHVVDEKILNAMELESQEATALWNEKIKEMSVLFETCKAAGNRLGIKEEHIFKEEQWHSVFKENVIQKENAVNQLRLTEGKIKDYEKVQIEKEAQVTVVQKALESFNTAKEIYDAFSKKDNGKNTSIEDITNSLTIVEESINEKKKEISKFENDYETAQLENSTITARYEETKKNITSSNNDYCRDLEALENCVGKENLETIDQIIEQLKDQINLTEKHLKDIQYEHKQNINISQSIETKLKGMDQALTAYGYIRDLENAARGNNQKRMAFEQYVLGAYFEEILLSANIRLGQMTEGRYGLSKVKEVSDKRKKNSLDIEVFDHYTGKCRSVKTLSGGESFKAALALALGLSDVVSSHAGGMDMDILFIDEGFGSLDEGSVETAVDTLMSISGNNRMIGIISHVGELKEKIEQQLVIEKTAEGSRIQAI